MSTHCYRYCPKCGDIDNLNRKMCRLCKIPTEETDIEVSIDYYGSNKQIIEQEIFTKYKIKENPLYDEEAVERRQKDYARVLKSIYDSPSTPYTPPQQNVPKCPTCGSTNINKISSAKKAAGFITVGIFSSNFGKTMECKNCGYKW